MRTTQDNKHSKNIKSTIRQLIKSLLPAMLLLYLSNTSFAQFKFQKDKEIKFHYLSKHFDELDAVFKISSVNEFEFRFWAVFEKKDSLYLFVLTKQNNILKARLFADNFQHSKKPEELAVDNNHLVELWQQLYQNNILALPEYSKLKTKEGNIPDIYFYDGNHYKFDFISGNAKKTYSYYCPKEYGKAYPYLKEFKDAQKLIELIFYYCRIELKC